MKMVKPYKRPSYRFYDKEKYLDFQNKLNRNELDFQEFVTIAIDDFLNGGYEPKNKEE
jgi:hypothetical protein